MRFSGAARTKLAEIEIILHQRQHPVQKQPLLTVRELIRLHTGGTEQDIEPFILCEGFSAFFQFLNIYMWHLDRCQRSNANWRKVLFLLVLDTSIIKFSIPFDICIFIRLIFQLHDTPDSSAEKAIVLLRICLIDRNTGKTHIGKGCLIAILLQIQLYRDHVNDRMRAMLPEL